MDEIKGTRIDNGRWCEADNFFACVECGKMVDMRDLAQVFHHEEAGHEAT